MAKSSLYTALPVHSPPCTAPCAQRPRGGRNHVVFNRKLLQLLKILETCSYCVYDDVPVGTGPHWAEGSGISNNGEEAPTIRRLCASLVSSHCLCGGHGGGGASAPPRSSGK